MTAGRLAGKRALVTGGGSGIGRATAVRLASEGARVAVLDADEPATRRTLTEIHAIGAEGLALHADVRDEAQVARSVDSTVAAFGGLDVLVANAAVQLFGEDARAHELELDVWERTLAVNLTGVFLTCKHGIRAMLASGGGSVVCTGSPTGLFGLSRGFDAYSASKAGVIGLARVLANDYAEDGIRVNVAVPGFTRTPLVASLLESDEEVAHRVQRIPMRRAGLPEEITGLMVFLASDDASYATGGIFCVDGGITAV